MILLVEDDPLQRRSIRRMLEKELSAEVLEASDGSEALLKLKSDTGQDIRLVLTDIGMPVLDGIGLIKAGRKLFPQLPFIVLTASENVNDAVEAMQFGAVDFITKPPEPARLLASVRNALALKSLQDEVGRLQQGRSSLYHFSDIVGVSPCLKEVCSLGRKAASSDIPVLITGESGVGKEVFAHAIHLESKRAKQPFVSVNCGALPENLVESTLFGHEKGAFTGATSKSLGKCREADGGVLFLDEVGELKPDAQVKLLRMLQQGEIEPVGAGKPVKVDVRVISATNRSLEQMVSRGQFREDLYYRLHGLPLHIPSLRERRKDIPELAAHLLTRIAYAEQKGKMTFSDSALTWLSSYGWPGNVRELQHMLSRAVLLCESDVIDSADLSHWAKDKLSRPAQQIRGSVSSSINLEGADGQLKTLEELEQEIFEAALMRYDAHIGRAAAALGIGQSTLYKRMRQKPSS
jgi:DNA-binding NtrC family response regulator